MKPMSFFILKSLIFAAAFVYALLAIAELFVINYYFITLNIAVETALSGIFLLLISTAFLVQYLCDEYEGIKNV